MPKLKNTTKEDITLSTGHVIKQGQTLPVSSDTLRKAEDHPFSKRLLKDKALLVEADEKAEIEENDARKYIAGAKKAELVELLHDHGLSAEDTDGKNVDQLRELAVKVVVVDDGV